ncbi:MAG TPA: DUF5916 domain-containing protein [Longimicrobium sp.]|jgi:hypothetical protein|uniref:carbohydrate binding family 9 domain-containing protein n=1 Tax=Longimicrobium sp. TaxID=2029185 RepID=UPI002EDAF3DF
MNAIAAPRRRLPPRLAAGLLGALALAPAARAQAVEAAPYAITRVSQPMRLDGVLDEPAWDSIQPVPMVKHWPSYGGDPTDRTEVRLAYDGAYVYASCRCYARPGSIQATTFKRDSWNLTNDQFALVLDTFNDNETALIFVVSPSGARSDAALSGDAAGATPNNDSWDTFWDAAVTRSDTAWFAEMRIPISSLRFQGQGGQVEMGLITYRLMAATNEMATWPAIEPKWGFWSFAKPSQGRQVALAGLRSRNPVQATPYVLAGMGRDYRPKADTSGYASFDEPARDVGLDLKYGLTNNLTLDVTVNTDFAQVEADDQQVNLTRFSLFFPEKRRFFQERASIFQYDLGDRNRLFYTRQIGLQGSREVPLLGGVRLVGRVGDWDVALLNMQSAREHELGLPSENFGVVRLRRQVLNPWSYVGGIATSRIGEDGEYNAAYGLDGVLRLFGDEYLTLNWAQTFDDSVSSGLGGLASARMRALWERRRYDGFGYQLSVARAGRDYDPALGFELRDDYTRIGDRLFHGWVFRGRKGPVQRLQVGVDANVHLRNADGSVETSELGPSLDVAFRSGATLVARVRHSFDDVTRPFGLSTEVGVPVGDYTFTGFEVTHNTSPARLLRHRTSLATGSYYDGRRVSLTLGPTWSASRFLELAANYQVNWVEFAGRDQELTAHIARLRAETTLNTRFALTTFVQYNSLLDGVTANLRLRYAPRDGQDFYLVVNEGMNTDRFRVEPALPRTSSRTVLLKYSHTFQF